MDKTGLKFTVIHGMKCPDCNVQIPAQSYGLAHDGRIYLMGRCDKCRSGIVLDIKDAITHLMEAAKKTAN